MPIDEFRCDDCAKITNLFTRKIDTELTVACEHCKSAKTSRMMSKLAARTRVPTSSKSTVTRLTWAAGPTPIATHAR